MNQLPVLLKKLLLGNTVRYIVLGLLLASCASYKQNIMFKVPDDYAVKQQVEAAEKNYVVKKNDLLQLEVYTKNGERAIDPDLELTKGVTTPTNEVKQSPTYLVDVAGVTKFPMIGEIKLEGLTIRQAEEMLQKAYLPFYKDSYVILKYVNKRVVVLGAPGGQVIPLTNDNIHLVEVLALARGLNNDAKAQNIKVLRQDQLFICDLSTFDGYVKNNIIIEPGDVIYVEPVRRAVIESIRDYGPIISIVTSFATLLVVFIQLR